MRQSIMRLVTMADDGYVPGLAALLQSLVENSGLRDPRMTVVMTRPIKDEYREALGAIGCELDFVLLSDLGRVPPRPNTRRHRKVTLQKLLLFNLPYDERLLFIDSDMLCLAPLGALDQLPDLAAVPQRGWREDRLDDGSPMFNTGLFTFQRDPAFAARVIDFYLSSTTPFELGDQVVLNRYFRDVGAHSFTPLDESWNTLSWAYAADRRTSVSGVRFLHFVGYKPWRNMLVAYDNGGRQITELYDLWWSYFDRSGASAVVRPPRPPRWVVELSHSDAVNPAWRLLRRTWLAARSLAASARRGRPAIVAPPQRRATQAADAA